MRERRFAPFFWTQFLGAFTDNAFKNALMLMVAFGATSSEAEAGLLIGIASGLFILPYFLFSPLTGQLADKYEKSVIMRRVKLAEIAIMLLAAAGFSFADARGPVLVPYLMFVLFLMGTQSTFFGPVKFSIIPQHLRPDELMHGTGLVEMGTFSAILLGTMVGGFLISWNVHAVSACLVACAIAGWLTSRSVPYAAPANPELKINLNWLSEIVNLHRIAAQRHSVYVSIIAISWFWLFGSMVLAQLPNLVKYFVGGDETVATLFLAMFVLSVSLGSVSTSLLSNRAIELGLVPLGAVGLTVFSLDLAFIDYSGISTLPTSAPTAVPIDFMGFLRASGGLVKYRLLFDLVALGVSGSFFIVPLYALLQHRSDIRTLSQVIAANNVANAVFMVASAVAVAVLYGVGFNTTQLFVIVASMNVVFCAAVFVWMPEFLIRLLVWLLGHSFYRVRFENADSIPSTGPCLLMCDRASLLDGFLVTTASQRSVRFVVNERAFSHPLYGAFLRLTRALPIPDLERDPAAVEAGVAKVREALDAGDAVGIFSSCPMTLDQSRERVAGRLADLLPATQIPVIPIAFRGLDGSIFERRDEKITTGNRADGKRVVSVAVGAVLSTDAGAGELRSALARLASVT